MKEAQATLRAHNGRVRLLFGPGSQTNLGHLKFTTATRRMLNAATRFYEGARDPTKDINALSAEYSRKFISRREEAWKAFEHFCVAARSQMGYKSWYSSNEGVIHTYEVSLRGDKQVRKMRAEILHRGKVIAFSDWQSVAPGARAVTEVSVLAAPGTYEVRQAVNVGDDIHENIVFQAGETLSHPPIG